MKDMIFKTLFKESQSFRILLNRIFNFYFNLDISNFNITSEELEIQHVDDINSKVDLLLYDEKNNYYLDIEVNKQRTNYYLNRNLSYEAKIVLQVFRNENDYKKKFKVIQVNINDFNCIDDKEIISSTLVMYDYKNNIKDERLTTHNLYLGKFKKMDYTNLSEIERDLAMLNCTDLEKMKELVAKDPVRRKVMSEYKKKISDKEFIEALFDPEWDRECIENAIKGEAREQGHAEGHAEGLAEGIKKGQSVGEKQKSLEIARKLINIKMPFDDISNVTGLSLEEIKELVS